MSDQIAEYVEQAYFILSNEDQAIEINARQVANLAYSMLDKTRATPSLVRVCAIEGLAQRARAFCRKHTDWEDAANEQNDDMFEDLLQDRYSVVREVAVADGAYIKKEQQEVYVRRDHLTVEEVNGLIQQMRRKGDKIMSHADALDRWNRERTE